MITALAKLGATQRISILLDYDVTLTKLASGEGSVTATVMFAPRDDQAPDIKPVQITGTIAEVEAHLATDFTAGIEKVAGLVTTLAEAEADLKKQAEEKKAEATKEKEKPKETATAKPKKEAKPAPVEPAKTEKPLAAVAGKPVPSLTPAWKKKPDEPKPEEPAAEAPPSDDDIAAMFNEEESK